nr:hypothetical protein [uncultured Campylobacter sp.]
MYQKFTGGISAWNFAAPKQRVNFKFSRFQRHAVKFQDGTRGMGIKNLRSSNRREACFLAIRSEISKRRSVA